MIAATALVARMRLVDKNAADFEPLRMSVERAPEPFPGFGPLELTRCSARRGGVGGSGTAAISSAATTATAEWSGHTRAGRER
jgi:hypothetical protein